MLHLLAALLIGSAWASAPVNTAGPLDCSTGICTQRLVTERIPFDSTRFRWTTLTQQFNSANEGENVASYQQMIKLGPSPSWSLVGETRCVDQRGGCHGAEIDLVVDGPLQPGDWRLGQSIVIWKMPGSTADPPTANFGLLVAPQWDQRENIRVDVGIGIQTRNNIAALQIRSGEKIALDDDGQIALRYNPATLRVELLSHGMVIWSVPTQ